MPETASLTASVIADAMKISVRYAEMLIKDIPADRFAEMPHPTMNHPAFCLGHLSLYPNKALEMMGMADRVVEKPGYAELFSASATCENDPGKYPPKDEIAAHFFERHQAVATALAEVSEEALERPFETSGPTKGMFQTVGAAVNFYLNSHNMLHMGQISAWRRAAGLPSVM